MPYIYKMKKILFILFLLPSFAFAQTVDLNEMSINGTIDTKGYFAGVTPELQKKEYGKFIEYKIRIGDHKIELMPCSKQATGKQMMAEMKKMGASKIKGLTIKKLNCKPNECLFALTRDGKTEYKASCVVISKGKEFFAMCDSDTSEEDAKHLLEIIQTFKMN